MTMKRNYLIASVMLLSMLAACGPQTPPYQGIKIGKPYEISGRTYKPSYEPSYDETGIASWYGPGFHGGKTASGERYDQNDMTAAHKTLPLPSIVRVTNLDNGKSAIVRINDRGPFASNRIIDLSRAAAIQLGVYGAGTAKVRVQFLDEETRDYVSHLPNGPKSLLALDKARVPETAAYPPQSTEEHSEIIADNEPQTQPAEKSADSTGGQDPFSVVDRNNQTQNTIQPFAKPQPIYREQVQQQSAYQQPAYVPDNAPQQILGGAYYVQAGTFGVRSNADRLLQQLEQTGNAKIEENTVRDRTLYRVVAGPYRTNAEAANLISRLNGMGISGAKIIKG